MLYNLDLLVFGAVYYFVHQPENQSSQNGEEMVHNQEFEKLEARVNLLSDSINRLTFIVTMLAQQMDKLLTPEQRAETRKLIIK